MIKIQVRSVLNIAKTLSGRNILVDMPEQSTLYDLLCELTNLYGQEFHNSVCNEDGYSDSKVSVQINGVNAAVIGGVTALLESGDDVLIMPVISGG